MYSNVPIGTSNPGCIVILIDQSWSMEESFSDGGTKAERATQAVNSVIESIVLVCRSGEIIRGRCHVSVIGYGERVDCLLDGMITEVAEALIEVKRVKKRVPNEDGDLVETDVQAPIWLEPKASNGTPMHEAFQHATEIVENWISHRPDSFPPIVINITDAMASDMVLTTDSARKVMNLKTSDGAVLVFNLHIANNQNRIVLPNDKTQLAGDSFAEFLFDISSPLPETLAGSAQRAGLAPEPGARCFAYNANETLMIQLLEFGSLGLTQFHRALPPPRD